MTRPLLARPGLAGKVCLIRRCRDIAGACVGLNSFSADTLVALSDGTLLPITEVQVGDQVLAYDYDTGTTVAREVTATLPHTDWLLDAHFSDGSIMSVTEDHRFWSVTDQDWVELQDLDTDDQLLTPDGVMVTVDWLDWDAGVTAPAWDLTVDDVHNFFVTAEADGEPLLVHNQSLGAFCGFRVPSSLVPQLAAVQAEMSDFASTALGRVLRDELSEAQRTQLFDVLASVDARHRAAIARGAGLSSNTRALLDDAPGAAGVFLGSKNYEFLIYKVEDLPISRVAKRLGELSPSEQQRVGDVLINSSDPDAALQLAALNPGDPLLADVAARWGV